MKVFIDTEFNGPKGFLISLGAVTFYGEEFYAEVNKPSVDYVPWVKDNVVPHLTGPSYSWAVFCQKVKEFLESFDDTRIEICYTSHQDMRYVHMILKETGVIKGKTIRQVLYKLQPGHRLPSVTAHNALSDAHALLQAVQEQIVYPVEPTKRAVYSNDRYSMTRESRNRWVVRCLSDGNAIDSGNRRNELAERYKISVPI